MIQGKDTDVAFYGRLMVVSLSALSCGLVFGERVGGVLVRARSDRRGWQTVMEPLRDVRWVWAEGADSVRVTTSNRVSHAVRSIVVARTDDARDGTCEVAGIVGENGGETVVDIELVQRSGDRPIASSAATLARVGGVNGGTIVVRSPANRDWVRHAESRVGLADAEGDGYAVYGRTVGGLIVTFK